MNIERYACSSLQQHDCYMSSNTPSKYQLKCNSSRDMVFTFKDDHWMMQWTAAGDHRQDNQELGQLIVPSEAAG